MEGKGEQPPPSGSGVLLGGAADESGEFGDGLVTLPARDVSRYTNAPFQVSKGGGQVGRSGGENGGGVIEGVC